MGQTWAAVRRRKFGTQGVICSGRNWFSLELVGCKLESLEMALDGFGYTLVLLYTLVLQDCKLLYTRPHQDGELLYSLVSQADKLISQAPLDTAQ